MAVLLLLSSLLLAYLSHRVYQVYSVFRWANCPIFVCLFHNFIPPGSFLGRIGDPRRGWVISQGRTWNDDVLLISLFERINPEADCWISLSIFPFLVELKVFDSAALREINTNNKVFARAMEFRSMLGLFGPSVLVTAGVEHRRHRAVAEPSFTAANSALVWEATTNIMNEIFAIHDKKFPGADVHLPSAITFTRRIALLVIKAAGFGVHSPWIDSQDGPRPGRKMTLDQSLEIIVRGWNCILRGFLPRLAYYLPIKNLREMDVAFPEFDLIMQDIMAERVAAQAQGEDRADLFGALIRSMKSDEGLNKREVLGNIFTYMRVMAKTTAGTLAFLFAHLALLPDVQQRLYEHVKDVLGNEPQLEYIDMPKLPLLLGAFLETIRLHSPAISISKTVLVDNVLKMTNIQTGDPIQVTCPKGIQAGAYFQAVHLNPRYFDEPMVFTPERFLEGSAEKEHFCGFSPGTYSCIGRKFAETEAVCIIANLLLHYKISVISKPNETREQLEERLLHGFHAITLQAPSAAYTFTRR